MVGCKDAAPGLDGETGLLEEGGCAQENGTRAKREHVNRGIARVARRYGVPARAR